MLGLTFPLRKPLKASFNEHRQILLIPTSLPFRYSKLLYEQDKSIEEEGLSNNMSVLKELVKQVCNMSCVPNIIISDRILQVF